MATLILLGAGASHDSEPDGNTNTPPLGYKLFSCLEQLGGVAANVPEAIKDVFRDDFETGMSLFNERCSEKLQSFHRELAHYLSGFSPSRENRYVQLLERLRTRNVIFASLNYDMMLEESAQLLGRRITYSLNRDGQATRLLKPHGSLNFWPAVPAGNITGLRLVNVKFAYEGPTQALDRLASRIRCIEDDSLSPAISMYAKGKHVSVCPSFVSNQQFMFASACKRASRIIVLGTRLVPEDTHIWLPIAKSSAELTYFGNDQDRVQLIDWCNNTGRKNVNFVSGYFEALLTLIDELI